MFRGAGWNVIKVIWGSKWDELLAKDKDGVLLNKMNTTVDGAVPALLGRVRRVHPRPLLRARSPPAQDGRRPHRRRAAQPAPRRPRLPQAVRRLQGGHREPRHRRPDGDPVQDDQGLDARRGLRGPQRHPPDQEDDQGPARRPARPAVPARRDPRRTRSTPTTRRTTVPAEDSRRVPVHDGAPPGARRLACPSASTAARRPLELPDRQAVRRAARRLGQRRRSSTTMGFTRLLRNLARDEHIGAARRADHPRRGPHVRHGRPVPRAQDLRRPGPEVRAGRPRPAAHLHRVDRRPDPRGGHHRGRLDGQLHRRRHQLRPPRRADGAVLHLLFDVRLPARRRPHLAGGRRPDPRLPARRHRRAHDAARRGPAAPGRPQPRAGQHGAGRARPTTRRSPTRWRPSSRPACSACTARTRRRTSATSSTTSPSTTRTTSMPPMPEGDVEAIDDGHRRGPVPVAGRRRRADPPGDDPVLGHAPRAPPARPSASWPSTTTSAPSCGRRRATSACARTRSAAERWNRLHPEQPAPHARWSPSCCADAHGPDRRRHRLHEDRARPDRPLPARAARSRRSAPTAWAAPTPARRCAASSRSTPATSSSPCSPRLAAQGDVKPEVVTDAIARYDIDPEAVNPSQSEAR